MQNAWNVGNNDDGEHAMLLGASWSKTNLLVILCDA